MATAISRINAVRTLDDINVNVVLDTLFMGPDVPVDARTAQVDVFFAGDAQPAAIKAAMSAAVSAHATSLGFNVAGPSMTLPTFQKG